MPGEEQPKFRNGSIVRIKLKNFLTYANVEFFPGPHMNMVIGPNGTGKSTVVCAIAIGLAGSPSILGRHKELKDFVKRGEEKASVEIELKGETENTVIRRSFKKAGNQSIWRINGTITTEKAVRDVIKQYNIQVDNLCQFLPQDKVASFAQLTPHQLLKETERAVGGDQLVALHDQMIEKRKIEVGFSQDVKQKRDEVEKLEAQNRLIERDVHRFQERETLQDNIKAINLRIAQISYDRDRDAYIEIKAQKQNFENQYNELINSKKPLLDRLENMKRELTGKDQLRTKTKTSVNEAQTAAKEVQKKVDAIDEKIASAENEKVALQKRREEHEKQIARLEKEIEVLTNRAEQKKEELIQSGLVDEDGSLLNQPRGPYAELESEMRKINSQMTQSSEGISECLQNKAGFQTEISTLNSKIRLLEKKLSQLDDIRQRKLNYLRSRTHASVRGDQVMQALEWVEQNRGRFKDRVFEPVCLEMNVRDPRYASSIECWLSNAQLTTFLVKNNHDYDLICDEMIGRRNLRINVAVVPKTPLSQFKSDLSREQIQELGFEGFAIDFLEGPEEVLAFICDRAKLHFTPISLTPVPSLTAVEDRHEIRSFISGDDRYVIRRAYGSLSTSISSIRQAQFLSLSVDMEAKNQYETELSQCMEALREIESKVARIEASENTLRKKLDTLRERKAELAEQKKNMAKVRKEYTEATQRRVTAREKLQNAQESHPSSDNKLERLDRKLRELEIAHTEACLELVNTRMLAATRFRDHVRANLDMAQTKLNVHRFETEINESDSLAAEALARLEAAKSELRQFKQVARTSLEALKELQGEVSEAIVNMALQLQDQTLEQLQAASARDKARIEMIMAIDPSIVDEYKTREKKIAEFKKYLDNVDEKLETHRAEMNATKKLWKGQLDEMISRVSASFSKAFQSIGCAGDAVLVEHEEYDQWAIEIQVKFRDTEKLQKLSGTRQSGGERSVSTILYLLALQDLSLSPFRVVDEINQGMDPRNERVVHRLILEAACGKDSCQYFLITPKLLPNLDYHEKMKILCVMNGVFQPERLNWRRWIPSRPAAV